MPYKDVAKQRAAQLKYNNQRRQSWFADNGPCVKCGSADNLQLDHKDPKQKVSHRIWSWAKERREAELVKCQALCRPCHKDKSAQELYRPITHGTRGGYDRGCRCEACKSHQIKRMKNYHEVNPR